MITKWKQYKCVINKHILDVHCVRLHNYVHWLSILLYQDKKFILNQTHVVLEVFFPYFKTWPRVLIVKFCFKKWMHWKLNAQAFWAVREEKVKKEKKEELNFPNQCLPSWSSSNIYQYLYLFRKNTTKHTIKCWQFRSKL